MSDSSKNNNNKPRVLIVGAGLGGLFLGALLERIDVPYTIFERTSTIKPLGSALSVGPPVLAMFEQLGMIDEIKRIGKRFTHVMDYSVDLKHVSPKSYIELEALTGYPQYIVSRPALHEILLKQIPSHKILLNKQIVIISETDDKVTIQATDDTVYEGELLVGADGAYSAVRQQLYAFLKKEGKLPEADHEELPFNCTCLVGQTTPLDPEEYPQLKLPLCQFLATQGLDVAPYSWVVFTTAQNTICWMVAHQLYETMNKTTLEQQAKDTGNPEWGAFAVQSTCDDTRSLLVPINDNKGNPLTVGDLYEKTPKEGISKVMLEEKVFETWYHGRTVLIGDACHKLNPAGGQGAATAMHDAVALANLIYALPCKTSADIEEILSQYRSERHPMVVNIFNASRQMSHTQRKDLKGKVARFVFDHMPEWLWRLFLAKATENRPVCGFLEQTELKGSRPANVSPSTEKARTVFEKRRTSTVSV